MEKFKPVIGYEGFYEVSNFGAIKSLERKVKYKTGGIRIVKESLIKPILKSTGYYVFNVTHPKRCQLHIHRMVAISFIPNFDNKSQVNHINGVKTDNMIENLEWCTQRENNLHSYAIGLKKISQKQKDFIRHYGKNRHLRYA